MRKLITLFAGLSFISLSYSQTGEKYSSESDVTNAINVYDHFTGNNAPLYNGKEYVFYTFRMKGDPFFFSTKFSKGWVSYLGKKYEPVSLLFDLSRNELILLNADDRSAVVLHNELVDSFSISGNKFLNLQEDAAHHLTHAGYYNVLYDGSIQVLAKRIKTISPAIENDSLTQVFASKNDFFIRKNGSYYSASNSKDVFHLFADKRRELKKAMRQNHVKFKRKTFENSLVKSAELYDKISH